MSAERPDDLSHVLTNDDAQDRVYFRLVVGFVASAGGRHGDALAAAKRALAEFDGGNRAPDHADWAWGLAARSAYALGDDVESDGLLAWLGDQRSTRMPPILQTERALAVARQAARREGPSAAEKFVVAIADQRRRSTPFHLAHGLLDYAEHLISIGRGGNAAELVAEAVEIAERLGAKPLLARAAEVRASEMITK